MPAHRFAINLSPTSVCQARFPVEVSQLLAKYQIEAWQLIFEVTESNALTNVKQAQITLQHLQELGCQIAIDDFGTGHSALIYLERYNFDYLKIDRGFVQAIGTETVTSPVLDAVLTLSRRLKLMTVAEGVETQEQAEWLRGQGVHFLQGTWISRPLSLAGLVAAHDEPANYFTTH